MNRNMLNPCFERLSENYLFAEVAARVAKHKALYPENDLVSLGIGDAALPIAEPVALELAKAASELSHEEGFRGYGPTEGYTFLREKISAYYSCLGARVEPDEIFINDGAKTDAGGLLELFRPGITLLVPDPVYPAYVDAAIMRGCDIKYVYANEENSFLPAPPDFAVDAAWLCSPNNPTGAAYDEAGLRAWVDYANGCGAVLLFDAAYERFVSRAGIPRSVYSIKGAKTCAIELGSFSKTAGFTGLRCGYTVVPRELARGGKSLRDMWKRRSSARFNGASYVVQRAAAAVFSPEGGAAVNSAISLYMENASLLRSALSRLGLAHWGGTDSPYIWFRCPGVDSWKTFDALLKRGVVCTPGGGFGKNGEGFCRLSAFATRENLRRAVQRLEEAGEGIL